MRGHGRLPLPLGQVPPLADVDQLPDDEDGPQHGEPDPKPVPIHDVNAFSTKQGK